MSDKIVVYGNEYCPMVPPVRSLMRRAGAPHEYHSITLDRAARRRVKEINQGNASVPTLVFPDGSTLTEPTLAVLTARLEALGHAITPETRLQRVLLVLESPSILLFGVAFLLIGVIGNQPSLTVAGVALLIVMLAGKLAALITQT
jgi:mycoredoxin